MSDATNSEIEQKIHDFSKLLDDISTLEDKKKSLWKEIYINAIRDRQNAHNLFIILMSIVKDQSTEHAVHGKTLATYIERMSKANDQLLKLAELITKVQEKENEIDPDDIYSKVNE